MATTKKTEAAATPASTTAKKTEAAAAPTGATATPNEGYCVKCKTKRVMKDPHEVTTNGRRMLKGTCPECGTNMNRILGKA